MGIWCGRILVAKPRKAKKAKGRHFRVPFVPLVPFVPIVPFHCMKNNARGCLRFSPVLRHRKARRKNQGTLIERALQFPMVGLCCTHRYPFTLSLLRSFHEIHDSKFYQDIGGGGKYFRIDSNCCSRAGKSIVMTFQTSS